MWRAPAADRSVLALAWTPARLGRRTMRRKQRQQALRFLPQQAETRPQKTVHLPPALVEQFLAALVLIWFRTERLGSYLVVVGHGGIFA
jgi:hypothetical protein